MGVYRFLARLLPRRAAIALTCLWFALLIALTIHLAFEPQNAFRYGRL
ncbi:hypothetical protein M1105_07415 [Limibaculum sp. FT325]|nr:hypothetical protein [Limibaculum sediminis]MCL5776812.1 hypothetical protein [Limibaculum sediminis]